MKNYMRNQADFAEAKESDHTYAREDEEYHKDYDYPKVDRFMVLNDLNKIIGLTIAPQPNSLILDSGASKISLCNFKLLVDLQRIPS